MIYSQLRLTHFLPLRLAGIFAAWFLLLIPDLAGAGTPRGWERILPGFSAPVYDLAQDPVDEQVLYAVCGWQPTADQRRMGGIFRSADGGRRWVEANRGIPVNAELLTLGYAPAGFIAQDPGLLLGTRGHGVLLSQDQGTSWTRLEDLQKSDSEPTETETSTAIETSTTVPYTPDWSRLAIQTILGIPASSDGPPAIVLGTKGHGVLYSVDGVTWETRNEGLLNLTIQSLARLDNGNLVAGTWYGGIYHSEDRGRTWESLHPRYERVAVSTIHLDRQGTLWVGMQNGGLAALPAGATDFESQGLEALEGVGILAIATVEDRVLIGTGGRGPVLGRYGRNFEAVRRGLESKTVSSIWIDPENPDHVILGTWAGMYRSIPPRSQAVPIAVGFFLTTALALFGMRMRRRSISAAVNRLLRGLKEVDAPQMPVYLGDQIASLLASRGQATLERLAERLVQLGEKEEDPRAELADLVRATAPLVGLLSEVEQPGTETCRLMADVLEDRIRALVVLAEKESLLELAKISWIVARRDQLYAALLRAENSTQLAASRNLAFELAEVTQLNASAEAFVDIDLVHDLCTVLDGLDQVGRLPSAEDRTLFLSQALTQVLATQGRLQRRESQEKDPDLGTLVGAVAMESIRQLLATAVQDIRQRAELTVELHSKVITARREAALVLELCNVGQGYARNIIVELQPQEDFRALRSRENVKNLLRDQKVRLEFLMEPRTSDRVRLRFRISYDDQVRRGQVVEFADMVELRPAAAPSTFQPLRPNPYVIGRPLATGDVFIGREDIFQQIEDNLRGAHQDNVVVLIGQRRVGKTSILRQLPERLAEHYVPVLVDLQGMLGIGEGPFFREIVATIQDELEERGIEVKEPDDEVFERDPASAFRRTFLRSVRRVLGERRLLLVFDEFEVLEERIRAEELPRQILPFFRSLMQHEKHVSFMFAGTHRLDELTGDYWGVLFNLAIYLEVGYLPHSEVIPLFTQPTQGYFEMDPLALDKIYQTTGGHPHLSQLVARELVEYRNDLQLSYVTVQDVNKVAGRVVQKGQLHISYLWDGASRSERLLLLAVKELLEREGIANLASAHQYLSEHRVEAGDLPAAGRSLVRRQILNDNAGSLDLRIGLLKQWLDHRHDLESFSLSENSGQELTALKHSSPEQSGPEQPIPEQPIPEQPIPEQPVPERGSADESVAKESMRRDGDDHAA